MLRVQKSGKIFAHGYRTACSAKREFSPLGAFVQQRKLPCEGEGRKASGAFICAEAFCIAGYFWGYIAFAFNIIIQDTIITYVIIGTKR